MILGLEVSCTCPCRQMLLQVLGQGRITLHPLGPGIVPHTILLLLLQLLPPSSQHLLCPACFTVERQQLDGIGLKSWALEKIHDFESYSCHLFSESLGKPLNLMCKMGIIRPTTQSCENEMRWCLTLATEPVDCLFPRQNVGPIIARTYLFPSISSCLAHSRCSIKHLLD